MKDSKYNKAFGTAAEKMVQKKLWSMGYTVRDYSNYLSFDLLVNDKYRVEVKYSSFKKLNKSRFGWNINGIKPKNHDVLAIVLKMPIDYKIFFVNTNDQSVFFEGKTQFDLSAEKIEALGFSENAKEAFSGKFSHNFEFQKRGILKPVLTADNWYSLGEIAELLKKTPYGVKCLVEAKAFKFVYRGKGSGARYSVKGEWLIEYLASLD
jgi:hypothetical protein